MFIEQLQLLGSGAVTRDQRTVTEAVTRGVLWSAVKPSSKSARWPLLSLFIDEETDCEEGYIPRKESIRI